MVVAAANTPALPATGPPSAEGSALAVALAPTPPQAANAAGATDAGGPSGTHSFFLMLTLAMLGVPALLLMTLLATVLTRR